MITIGITGGIGTGKSTVSEYLQEKGYRIIDCDAISRGITKAGSPALEELRQAFGDGIFRENGELDRKKTAAVVFSDPEKKAKLERIVTDRVFDELERSIRRAKDDGLPAVFLDAPILFETGADRLCDRVWLVTAEEDLRIRRVASRDGMTAEEVRRRIRSQMPEEEKKKRSDSVLDNSGSVRDLQAQIDELLRKIKNSI